MWDTYIVGALVVVGVCAWIMGLYLLVFHPILPDDLPDDEQAQDFMGDENQLFERREI